MPYSLVSLVVFVFIKVDKISRATGHVEDLCSNKLPVVHNSIMTSVGDQKAGKQSINQYLFIIIMIIIITICYRL